MGRAMPANKDAREYSNCSFMENREACIARGLPYPIMHTYDYKDWSDAIDSLIQADADAGNDVIVPFRFGDLYPNIRRLIYEQLLTFSADSGCHPQILATTSCVYDEASSILYEENVLDIIIDKQTGLVHLTAWKYPDPSTAWDLAPCKHIGKLPILSDSYADGSLSDFVFYFKRVRLVLDTAEFAEKLAITTSGILAGNVESELQTFDRLSARLFAVAALLQDCTALQELVVDVRGCFTEKYRTKVMDAMRPLARMWDKVECKFYGFRPSDFIETFLAKTAIANAHLYKMPMFRKARLLQKEMASFDLLNKAGMAERTLSKYKSAKSELIKASKFPFRDASDEWLFNSSLEFIGRVLTTVYEEEPLCPPDAMSGSWSLLAIDFEDAHAARVKELEGEEGTARWN